MTQILLHEAASILRLSLHELNFLVYWGAVPTTPIRGCSLPRQSEVICNGLIDLEWVLQERDYLDRLNFSKVKAPIEVSYKQLDSVRHKPDLKQSGIYAIKDRLVYVGQSKNIWRRWHDHLGDRYKNRDKSNLTFAVLEFVNEDKFLNEKERYWESKFYPWIEGQVAVKRFYTQHLMSVGAEV
jgi:hypothetical protein